MSTINTRSARRDAEKRRKRIFDDRLSIFKALFHNSVIITGDADVPKRYLLKELLNKGAIAYDRATGLYLPFVGTNIDNYGLYTQYTLIGYKGLTMTRDADEVVILRANDLQYPLINFLSEQCEKIADIEMSVYQNLEACKTMTIAETSDDTFFTNAQLVESRRVGATIFYKNTSSPTNTLKIDSTGATYLVDKLMEARQKVINETLSALCISSANTDKRERVQSQEILASEGFAIEMGKTLFDTFNYDAEAGGIPIRLESNLELIFENEIDNEIKKKEVIENEDNTI